jgi:hypothetical protein
MSSVQLLCNRTGGAVPTIVTFPDELGPYSNVINTIKDTTDEDDASGSDCEEEESSSSSPHIPVTASPETVAMVIELLKMNYKDDYSNATPTPKKVTAPKFDIQKELGADTVEFLEESGKDGVFSMATLGDFLGINLVTHMCYTWIAHMLNTLGTQEKMDYLGLTGEPPTFEEIMAMNLDMTVDDHCGDGGDGGDGGGGGQ